MPDASAPPVDFIAALQTASLHFQRLIWSRQIAKLDDRTQSEAVIRSRPKAAAVSSRDLAEVDLAVTEREDPAVARQEFVLFATQFEV